MEFDGLTRACASWAEFRSVRRGKAVLVGMGCSNDNEPQGELVSWGLTGSLDPKFKLYDPIEGTSVVDINGNKLWERDPVAKPTGLREATVYATDRVIDDPDERAWLRERTGAQVLDMESAVLARTGRLRRIVRIVSDDADALLHMATVMLKPNGSVDKLALIWALRVAPWDTSKELVRLCKAVHSLRSLHLP